MGGTNRGKLRLNNGEILEVFSAKMVADQLGRSVSTVRKWDLQGIIPATPFKGRFDERLYSEEHIRAIVSAARISGISSGMFSHAKRLRFTELLVPVFAELKEKYRRLLEVPNGEES